jgi:hypothetical protein
MGSSIVRVFAIRVKRTSSRSARVGSSVFLAQASHYMTCCNGCKVGSLLRLRLSAMTHGTIMDGANFWAAWTTTNMLIVTFMTHHRHCKVFDISSLGKRPFGVRQLLGMTWI